MNFRDLLTKLDNIVEAADPQLYADAQAMMANLEKAAQYTGDDEIVRYRMGLPPKLPPIEQWDGKMPAPIGKPDWVARLTTMGKATDDQAVAVKRNAAIGSSRQFITTNMTKLKELVDKLKATMASSQPQAVKESIARNLIESFGYTVEGFNDSATDLIRQRAASQAAAAPGTPLSDFGSVGKARAERAAAAAAEKAAAEKAAAAAASPVAKVAQQAGISGAEKAAGTALAKGAASTGGKLAGRLIPGVSSAIDAADAYSRRKEGDKTGAAIAGLGALGGLIPGVGTAISMGTMAANQARDYKAGRGAFAPDGETKPAAGQAGQPAKSTAAAGSRDNMSFGQAFADAKAKGEKEFMWKGKPYAVQMEENSVATFKQRLELIEAKARISESLADEYFFDWNGNLYTVEGEEVTDELTKQVIWESVRDKEVIIDEGIWDKVVGGAMSAGRGARDFFKGAAGGVKSPDAATRLAAKPATGAAKSAGLKTGAAIKKNPVKTAAAGVAAGTAAGLGLSGGKQEPAATTAATGTGPSGASGQAAQPATEPATTTAPTAGSDVAKPIPATPAGPTPEQTDLIKQIQDLMSQLADVEEQPVMAALQDAQATIDAASKAAAPSGQAAQPAAAPGKAINPETGDEYTPVR